jgi:hypothetical protein
MAMHPRKLRLVPLQPTEWTEEVRDALGERFDAKQKMDLVFTVGQYTLVSMTLNTLGVQREPGVEGFPI